METTQLRQYSECSGENQSNVEATPGAGTTVSAPPTTTGRKFNLDNLDKTLKTGASIAQSAGSVADTFKGIFGKKPSAPAPTTDGGGGSAPTPDAPKPGMGTGMKVAIAVGVLGVIGLGVYLVMKKK
jgi:hypothetical protein